ncbi:proline-rich receptor-like protein kinase PERK13 [Abrus precatorius]|uniref:non-specific serine/threonine protein kinase n=1 Tax=Abrus precatorius TaxID=3816 RepID=A0A8B8M6S4_ABRPR|nr:proline-rich receptor-like protein kinase PERK13 [Abrus precatorius]
MANENLDKASNGSSSSDSDNASNGSSSSDSDNNASNGTSTSDSDKASNGTSTSDSVKASNGTSTSDSDKPSNGTSTSDSDKASNGTSTSDSDNNASKGSSSPKENSDKASNASSSDSDKGPAPSPKSSVSESPKSAPSLSPPPATPPPSPPPSPSPPPPPSKKSAPPPSPPPPSPSPSPSPPPRPPPSPSPSPSPSPPSPSASPPSQPSPLPPPPSQQLPPSQPLVPPPPPPPSPWVSPPTPPSPSSHGSGSNHSPPPPSQSPPNSRSKPSTTSPQSDSPSTSPSSRNNTAEYVGFALAGFFLIAFVAAVLFFVLRKRKKRGSIYAVPPHKKPHMKGGADLHYYVQEPGYANGPQDGYYASQPTHAGAMQHIRSSSDTAQPMNTGQIVFTYDKIAEITSNFSSENVIGEGGFGCVYKASMPDGRVGAVKILKAGSGQGEREFRAEVEIISRVHHRHLVSLIGYCIAEQERVLIYEYVPNGNLDQHLHGNDMPILEWPKRVKIAIGAARGLAYLHEGCNPRIIHRDIKSANILLDDAYEAQVADFGLARLTDDANTHVSTRVMGTFGYMAPEYATSGKLTDRSDVFSFGVVLLELITGRKPVDPTQPIGEESLVEWARPLLLRAVETGDFGELVDPRLERQYIDSEMFRMIEAAAACVRHSAPKRPRMVQVVRALDSGDQQYDLSNGVKYGQSTVYDSGQYNEDIMRFRRLANGSFGDSEYDMYSEYNSKDMAGAKHRRMTSSAGGDSEFKALNSQSTSAQNM